MFKQSIRNFLKRSRTSKTHFRADPTHPQTDCATLKGFEPDSGMFGHSQAVSRNSQPQKEIITQKNNRNTRRMDLPYGGRWPHLLVYHFICGNWAGSPWMAERKRQTCTEKQQNSCQTDSKNDFDMHWVLKAKIRTLHSLRGTFPQRKGSMTEKKQHNREKNIKTIKKNSRPAKLIESNRRSNRE